MSKPKPETKKRGRSLDDFRAAHDKSYIIPTRIRDALKQLGDSWEYEVDFLRRCALSTTDLATYRDEFEADHIVIVAGSTRSSPKRVWAGTKELATKLREMV